MSKLTLKQLAQISTASILGRTSASTGDVEVLSGTQATALLDLASGSTKGLLSSADFTKLAGVTGTNSGDETYSTITTKLSGGSGGGTTNFLRADGTWAAPASGVAWGGITGTLSSQTDLQSALDLKAPLASPTFTGTVTAPTVAGSAGVSLDLSTTVNTLNVLGTSSVYQIIKAGAVGDAAASTTYYTGTTYRGLVGYVTNYGSGLSVMSAYGLKLSANGEVNIAGDNTYGVVMQHGSFVRIRTTSGGASITGVLAVSGNVSSSGTVSAKAANTASWAFTANLSTGGDTATFGPGWVGNYNGSATIGLNGSTVFSASATALIAPAPTLYLNGNVVYHQGNLTPAQTNTTNTFTAAQTFGANLSVFSASADSTVSIGRLGDLIYYNNLSIFTGYNTTAPTIQLGAQSGQSNFRYTSDMVFSQTSTAGAVTYTERLRLNSTGMALTGNLSASGTSAALGYYPTKLAYGTATKPNNGITLVDNPSWFGADNVFTFGSYNGNFAFTSNSPDEVTLKVSASGTFQFRGNNVWHAGNFSPTGSQSFTGTALATSGLTSEPYTLRIGNTQTARIINMGQNSAGKSFIQAWRTDDVAQELALQPYGGTATIGGSVIYHQGNLTPAQTNTTNTFTAAQTFSGNVTVGNSIGLYANGTASLGNTTFTSSASTTTLTLQALNTTYGSLVISSTGLNFVGNNGGVFKVEGNTVYHAGNLTPVSTTAANTFTAGNTFTLAGAAIIINPAASDARLELQFNGTAKGGLSVDTTGPSLYSSFGVPIRISANSAAITATGSSFTFNANPVATQDGNSAVGRANALWVADTRSIADTPTSVADHTVRWDFKLSTNAGSPPVTSAGSPTYSHIMTVQGWQGGGVGGGGDTVQWAFGDGLAFRSSTSSTTWGSWKSLWHSGNFSPSSYAALSGATFTGNVGINVAPSFALDVSDNGANIAIRSTSTTAASLRYYVNGTERGKVAADNTGNVIIESSGVEKGRFYSSGFSATGTSSSTGYGFFDISSTSARVYIGATGTAGNSAVVFRYGTTGAYSEKTLLVDNSGALSFSGNASFTGQITGTLINGSGGFRPTGNAGYNYAQDLGLSKSGNDLWLNVISGTTGYLGYIGSTRLSWNSAGVQVNGDLTVSNGGIVTGGTYTRSGSTSGYMNLGYGGVSTANSLMPIACISTNYQPTNDTTIGSMYGIGYSYSGSTSGAFSGYNGQFSAEWGQYVAVNGIVRVFMGVNNWFSGSVYAGGNITAAGTVTGTSDAALKKNVSRILDARALVMGMEGVRFDWIDDEKPGRQIGFIAQNVRTVAPELVLEGKEHLSLAYGNVTAVHNEAIKELYEENEDLRARIERLEAIIQKL